MARKRKTKKRSQRPADGPLESPQSLFVTTGWMVCVLTTLACTLVGGLGEMLLANRAASEGTVALVRVLQFGAIVTAVVALLLTPVVYRVRREPPPRGLSIFALAVCGAALLTAFR